MAFLRWCRGHPVVAWIHDQPEEPRLLAQRLSDFLEWARGAKFLGRLAPPAEGED